MTATGFAFDGVCKTFRSRAGEPVDALRDFSCAGQAGRITCLLGPTGCGKTTALRMMAGLETPHAGQVVLDGKQPGQCRGELAYVPQQHTLFPWLRLLDNVAFPLMIRRVARRQRRRQARRFLGQVGLEGKARLYPYECSGGMQQRVMLARQLAAGATAWLLDEPFESLDERTRYALQDLLLELRRTQSLSVLFVTHNIEEAVFLADRIVVMSLSPGRAVETIDLDTPHPRDRLSPAFSAQIERVRTHIGQILLRPNAAT